MIDEDHAWRKVWAGGLSICQGSNTRNHLSTIHGCITSRWRKPIERWMKQVLNKNHSATCLLLHVTIARTPIRSPQSRCTVALCLGNFNHSKIMLYLLTIMSGITGIQTYCTWTNMALQCHTWDDHPSQ